MCIYGHEVIGHEVVYQDGCFTSEKFWVRGWQKDVPGFPQYVQGYTGRETVITRHTIRPMTIVEVSS